jgi:peptidoglycan hydrolase-like protein with peptidoglycan-binding domain
MYKDRATWGARTPLAQVQPMNLPVQDVYLHHTVTRVTDDSSADAQRVTDYSKYIDVPYNIMVHPNGDVLQGRYLGSAPALGAHTAGKNTKSFGIALIGNYVGEIPTEAALDSIARVIESWVEQGQLTGIFNLRSHSDAPYATACCGTNLKAQIANILAKANDYIKGTEAAPIVITAPVVEQVPVNNYPAYPMLLMRGTKGGFVKQLQTKLGITADGDFGKITEKAVKAFQKANGLDVDGLVGKLTWNKLFREGAVTPPPAPVVAAPIPFPGTLKRGSIGIKVRVMQQKMKDGGMNIVVDGDFGKATEVQVKHFQQFRGLEVDGIMGEKSWRALFSI